MPTTALKSPRAPDRFITAGPLPPFKDHLRAKVRSGLKTMTRRLIKPQPRDVQDGWYMDAYNQTNAFNFWTARPGSKMVNSIGPNDRTCQWTCPYGFTGDIKYLREPLIKRCHPKGFYVAHYADDDEPVIDEATEQPVHWRWKDAGLAQLFLPKEYARTFVKLTGVRAERLHAITNNDALAEGTPDLRTMENNWDLRQCFAKLWDDINEDRCPWSADPFVWVLTWEPA